MFVFERLITAYRDAYAEELRKWESARDKYLEEYEWRTEYDFGFSNPKPRMLPAIDGEWLLGCAISITCVALVAGFICIAVEKSI